MMIGEYEITEFTSFIMSHVIQTALGSKRSSTHVAN